MSDEGGVGDGYRLNHGGAMSWFSLAMVAVVIAIAVAIVFLFFLHLYSKWYLRRHRTSYSDHDINNLISGNAVAGGLDASVLRSLHVVSFKIGDYKGGMECSVCLCEVSEGEQARLLPNCNHGFHLECIDMWFRSHSTCPLCRSTVSLAPALVSGHAPPETTDIPTNVLLRENDDPVNAGRARVEDGSTSPSTSSTSSSTTSSSSPAAGAREEDAGGKIVIDVARQNGVGAEESPRSPATRLRSSRRKLFHREGRWMAWSTREEGEGDVEQGMAKL